MFILLSFEILKDERLSLSEKVLYAYYKTLGEVPSISKTSKDTGIKRTTITLGRIKLRKLGLIE